jgi:hypothetical protein
MLKRRRDLRPVYAEPTGESTGNGVAPSGSKDMARQEQHRRHASLYNRATGGQVDAVLPERVPRCLPLESLHCRGRSRMTESGYVT